MKVNFLVMILTIAVSGCASNSVELEKLKSEVENLRTELANCSKTSSPSLIEETALKPAKLNMRGLSYGGIVRAQASMNSSKIMSLKYGEKVTLLERTEAIKDDYYWFKIQSESGLIGYQWGGLLCSFSNKSVGAFRVCENFKF
ncbi:MAG: SH3 domain-containing protein [Alteromonadaceae bacterium]|nr:SH3 domain-containing protein [Alteromonadaceae bacterium]